MGPIASRLKILANMDIVDRHRSQDGQLEMTIDGRPVDIRVSTMETIWGEKVVLRLLDRTRSLVPLAELGLQPAARERVRRLIDSPYGMLVVAGPTGAGKTTTLYAALSELDPDLLLLLAGEDVDDPVDRLGGVVGVQRGEDQVTGLGDGEGDADRFQVAHLAHQQDVGVLAQAGAERVPEGCLLYTSRCV